MKAMIRLSIPERLRDGMLLKTANYFEVPDTKDGHSLMEWWEKSASELRDTLMKQAYDNNVTIVEALKNHLASQE